MFNILIVEDDYELRHLFQRVLVQNGYRVRGVEDGKAALKDLEKEYRKLCNRLDKTNLIYHQPSLDRLEEIIFREEHPEQHYRETLGCLGCLFS